MGMPDVRVPLLFTTWEEPSEWFKVLNNNFQSKHHRDPAGEIYNN